MSRTHHLTEEARISCQRSKSDAQGGSRSHEDASRWNSKEESRRELELNLKGAERTTVTSNRHHHNPQHPLVMTNNAQRKASPTLLEGEVLRLRLTKSKLEEELRLGRERLSRREARWDETHGL